MRDDSIVQDAAGPDVAHERESDRHAANCARILHVDVKKLCPCLRSPTVLAAFVACDVLPVFESMAMVKSSTIRQFSNFLEAVPW
jgi:hypothetical protein